jgi:predicted secreted Zn-dependent protease
VIFRTSSDYRAAQTHFDLAELHARKMRKAIAALADPCAMTEDQRRAVVSPFIDEDRETQRRYDRETSNGRDVRWQAEWIRNVSLQLDALRRYADSASQLLASNF